MPKGREEKLANRPSSVEGSTCTKENEIISRMIIGSLNDYDDDDDDDDDDPSVYSSDI